jgi:sensor c-di-GMP phosphodiesterase-like protein
MRQTARDISFCGHAILSNQVTVINDATEDVRFVDNPMVTGRLGVTVAIDDFGIGYSSLAYLRQLPIDALKIAQPFVREIGINLKNTPNDLAIVTAVTNLAHSLGMRVIAEGVETEEQLVFLEGIGCNEMQGYLTSPPMPVEELELLLEQEAERQVTRIEYQSKLASAAATSE